MNNIRVIIDDVIKMYNQYNQIRNLLPNHTLYIYKKINTDKQEIFNYNIFIDTISEKAYELCPAKNTILFVNEEYVNVLQYLRREFYIDKPLIPLSDVVDYYLCQTLYTKNILKKRKINKNKIIYSGLLTGNIDNSTLYKQKYIYYDIDLYSGQDNLVLLTTWMKYFINRQEILIISYKYKKDAIVRYNDNLFKTKKFKNIILKDDAENVNLNIYASIINTSNYNFTTTLCDNILNNRLIITVNNDIFKPSFGNVILMDKFNEENIKKALNNLFNLSDKEITSITTNNKTKLLKQGINGKNIISKFFKDKHNDSNHITPYVKKINYNTNFKQIYMPQLIIKSHNEIKNVMNDIDNKFNKIKNNNSEKFLNKYYRILKKPDKHNKTKFAFATIIILSNTYISSILALGYMMKHVNKTKYNLICFVQDKPHYEDEVLKFPGLSSEEINDIGKFYDCIVGIDLLKIKTDRKLTMHYTNARYFATKLLCFGFTYYSKILYYDASTVIQTNIDYYMTKYNENKYYNTNNEDLQRGMVGNIYMFIPKTYYINKAVYLLENYIDIFAKQYKYYLPDEDLLYYTVYPNWSKNQIDCNEIASNYISDRYPYIKTLKEPIKYNFNLLVIEKPFMYSLNPNSTLFNSNQTCYKSWDEAVAGAILKYPELDKYFEFIKTFRYTLF